MDTHQYQGLFHLTLGTSLFLLLMLGLRMLADWQDRSKSSEENSADPWHTKERLKIVEVIEETHDIKSFRMARASGQPFPGFKPGQFLSFQIGESEKDVRSYSIASSATNQSLLTVAIKRVAGGQGSNFFHQLKVGDFIWAYPPSGHFTDADLRNEQRIFIAGGIGVTPMLSMILSHLDRGTGQELHLFYGMRSRQDMAFHATLALLSQRHKNFHYFPLISHDETLDGFEHGFLSLDLIRKKIQLRGDAHFFICGPSPMMNSLTQQLLNVATGETHIHTEEFISPSTIDPEKVPVREAKVTFKGQTFAYQGRQSLLEFLESKGQHIPFSCRAGVCGTCKCKVTGEVQTLTSAGLTLTERQQGLVLSCVAFPKGEVTVTT